MQYNTIEILEWDSQFFGYPVAKIEFNSEGRYVLNHLLNQLIIQSISLTYFFVPLDDPELNLQIVKIGGILVDQKTTFSKVPEKHSEYTNQIFDYPGNVLNEKLIQLALLAGTFSRFRIDKNFKNQEYEKLYTEWLKKSLENKIAFKTLVATKNSEFIGITTLKKEKLFISIGLVSVDEKYHGQGIGVDLIHKADTIAFDLKNQELKVVTQLQNESACKLYKKCGFQIKEVINVYHCWNN